MSDIEVLGSEYELLGPDETDSDSLECARYLFFTLKRHSNKKAYTIAEIAQEMGFSVQTLYTRIARWRQQGILEPMEMRLRAMQREAVNHTARTAIMAFGEMVNNLVHIATTQDNRNAIDAFRAVKEEVINPYLLEQSMVADEALEFIQGKLKK